MSEERRLTGYHFTGDCLRDGRPIPAIGEWLIHAGVVIMCKAGLHMCEHPLDAVQYAINAKLLHRIELEGDLETDTRPAAKDPNQISSSKYVGRRRRILATINASALLREFACWSARQIVDRAHVPTIVYEYLVTCDPAIRYDAYLAMQNILCVTQGGFKGSQRAAYAATTSNELHAVIDTVYYVHFANDSYVTAHAASIAQRAKFVEMVNAEFQRQP